jgi:hypothetical protein
LRDSQINSIRLGGFGVAFLIGLYAAFVVWYYRDDPAGIAPCQRRTGGGSSDPTLADSASGNGSRTDHGPVDPGVELQLVQSYGVFCGLLGAIAVPVGLGAAANALPVRSCCSLRW